MGGIINAVFVLLMALQNAQRARASGQWSWPAFAWTLALVFGYAAICMLALMIPLERGYPTVAVAAFAVVLIVGIVVVVIVARRINRRYLPPESGSR
ncbi:MAG: hypothetical protein ACLPN5_15440 [Roseiarcus sp.]